MVRADLMPFPTFSGSMEAGGIARASMGMSTSSATYTPLGQEVVRDVEQFIAQGASAATVVTSAQAQWLALQATKQLPKSSTSVDGVESTQDTLEDSPALTPEQQAFLQRIAPWAKQTAQRLGVSVRSVMAHAALESGWGQHPLRGADGQDAYNLFGIKATGGWSGASTLAATTEFEAGVAVQRTEPFRQYAGLDATFADYAQLLERSPRYRAALGTGDDVPAFARALAAGGYATDPHYAQKLVRVSQLIPVRP